SKHSAADGSSGSRKSGPKLRSRDADGLCSRAVHESSSERTSTGVRRKTGQVDREEWMEARHRIPRHAIYFGSFVRHGLQRRRLSSFAQQGIPVMGICNRTRWNDNMGTVEWRPNVR